MDWIIILIVFIVGVIIGWWLYGAEGAIALGGFVTLILTTYRGRSKKTKIAIYGVLVVFLALVVWWLTKSFPPQ